MSKNKVQHFLAATGTWQLIISFRTTRVICKLWAFLLIVLESAMI
jgi:hypothetical protein